MGCHGCIVGGDIDGHPVVGSDFLGQVEGEAVRVFEFERFFTRDNQAAFGFHLTNNCIELDQTTRQRTQELLFFGLDGLEDEGPAALELGVGSAHQIDEFGHDAGKKRLVKTNQPALIDRPAQDSPQHIRTTGVAGQHAIGNQKGDGAAMVCHRTIGGDVGAVVGLGLVTELFDGVDE